MTERLTPDQLQDVSDIIRSVTLSRGVVETSTPEQIVHLTSRAIEANLIAYANGEDSRYRWLPTVYGTVADIRRGVELSRLTDKTKATVLGVIDRAATGWPA